MSLNAWALTTDVPPRLGYIKCALNVSGTSDIQHSTDNLREYLSGIDVEAIGADAGISDLRTLVNRCINIATLNDQSQRVCFTIDEPRANGEYALFEADVDECMNWLLLVASDLPKIHIADSFGSFIAEALAFMIEHGTGFNFWESGPEVVSV